MKTLRLVSFYRWLKDIACWVTVKLLTCLIWQTFNCRPAAVIHVISSLLVHVFYVLYDPLPITCCRVPAFQLIFFQTVSSLWHLLSHITSLLFSLLVLFSLESRTFLVLFIFNLIWWVFSLLLTSSRFLPPWNEVIYRWWGTNKEFKL